MPARFMGSGSTGPDWHPSTPCHHPPISRICPNLPFPISGWPAPIPATEARRIISITKSAPTFWWRINGISTSAAGPQVKSISPTSDQHQWIRVAFYFSAPSNVQFEPKSQTLASYVLLQIRFRMQFPDAYLSVLLMTRFQLLQL